MRQCRVQHVSDTRSEHMYHVYFEECHVSACRVHVGIAVSCNTAYYLLGKWDINSLLFMRVFLHQQLF